jgi:valyl-tRNA synthetase
VRALKDMLKLLHPFMPFITEEIWSFLPKNKAAEDNPEGFLIKESWPVYDGALTFKAEVKKLELAMEAIRSIRNIRAEAEAAPSRKLHAVILSSGKDLEDIRGGERYIRSLANITDIEFITDKSRVPEEVMSAVIGNVEIYIPLDDLTITRRNTIASKRKRRGSAVKLNA